MDGAVVVVAVASVAAIAVVAIAAGVVALHHTKRVTRPFRVHSLSLALDWQIHAGRSPLRRSRHIMAAESTKERMGSQIGFSGCGLWILGLLGCTISDNGESLVAGFRRIV